MQILPQIFDGVAFIEPPDQDKLPPEALTRLADVRNAWQAMQAAGERVKTEQANVAAAEEAVAVAERAVKPFGEYGFHRLWQQHVKGI